jgi:DNA-binding NtrC family response regulator
MAAYPWPGNVRELQNVLQRIIVLGESEGTLDAMLTATAISPASTLSPAIGGSSSLMRMLAADGGEVDLSDLALKKISKKATNQAERELISFVLIKTGWNRSKASRILHVSYKTLLQKIGELAIVPPPELA